MFAFETQPYNVISTRGTAIFDSQNEDRWIPNSIKLKPQKVEIIINNYATTNEIYVLLAQSRQRVAGHLDLDSGCYRLYVCDLFHDRRIQVMLLLVTLWLDMRGQHKALTRAFSYGHLRNLVRTSSSYLGFHPLQANTLCN